MSITRHIKVIGQQTKVLPKISTYSWFFGWQPTRLYMQTTPPLCKQVKARVCTSVFNTAVHRSYLGDKMPVLGPLSQWPCAWQITLVWDGFGLSTAWSSLSDLLCSQGWAPLRYKRGYKITYITPTPHCPVLMEHTLHQRWQTVFFLMSFL